MGARIQATLVLPVHPNILYINVGYPGADGNIAAGGQGGAGGYANGTGGDPRGVMVRKSNPEILFPQAGAEVAKVISGWMTTQY
jgi:hypothetical protein